MVVCPVEERTYFGGGKRYSSIAYYAVTSFKKKTDI